MRIFDYGITFVEVPTEVNLTFFVDGCPYGCSGCFWDGVEKNIRTISMIEFESLLIKYKNKATCIVFLGGEWFDEFSDYLSMCKKFGFKTCLYTGIDTVHLFKISFPNVYQYLDYIKVGHYEESLGGLDKNTTNQKLFKINNQELKEIICYE